MSSDDLIIKVLVSVTVFGVCFAALSAGARFGPIGERVTTALLLVSIIVPMTEDAWKFRG